jgi:hypothetical protein
MVPPRSRQTPVTLGQLFARLPEGGRSAGAHRKECARIEVPVAVRHLERHLSRMLASAMPRWGRKERGSGARYLHAVTIAVLGVLHTCEIA